MELTMKQKVFMVVELEYDEDAEFDFNAKWELVPSDDKDFPYAWLINGVAYDYLTEAFGDRVKAREI